MKPPVPTLSPTTYTTTVADSPVQVEKRDDAPRIDTALSASSAGNSEADQRGRTIRTGGRGGDAVAEYIARLTKKLQSNLVYPEETRKHGVEGVTWISFTITESGAIKEGSLRVRTSSGYASLDSNALKSALASAPFEKPPKQLTIKIAVEFNVEMMSRAKRISTR